MKDAKIKQLPNNWSPTHKAVQHSDRNDHREEPGFIQLLTHDSLE